MHEQFLVDFERLGFGERLHRHLDEAVRLRLMSPEEADSLRYPADPAEALAVADRIRTLARAWMKQPWWRKAWVVITRKRP